MSIASLVQKYERGIDEYRNPKYNETQLRNDFLDPFFELLGWDIRNANGKPTNEREVLVEEGLKAEKSANTKKPDYTFRLFAERKFFAEAKKPSVRIEADSEAAKQVRRYGFTANLKISILTNFEYLIIYDCSSSVTKEDNFHTGLVQVFHFSEYVSRFEELVSFIGHDPVYDGRFDNIWEFVEQKASRITVDDLFLSQINAWRILLGQEIYRHMPAIDNLRLNDQVQSYLNRIVFLRVCEDRNLEEYKTLLDFANTEDFNALINKFKEADAKYNSGLFDQLLSDEIVGNVSSVFWHVIHQLYYPESPYSFSVLSSDILGKIYEIFLTEQLQVMEGGVTLVKKPENIDKDIVTTPTYIIQDIIRETMFPYCLDKNDLEIMSIRVADIACGSGSFLLEAYQFLNDRLIDYYLENGKENLIQTGVETFKLPFNLKVELLLNCIHGVDKDYNAVEAAKFGLLLKLLENEDTNTTALGKPILPNLNGNIHFGNSLISPSELNEFQISQDLYERINPFDFTDTSFNIIIGNPPYMKSEDMKNITPEEYAIYNKLYDSAYKQYDKYFLFVERTLSILSEGGVYGYILPIKFTKVGAGQKLRESLLLSRTLRVLVSFGANQIFSSKTTYTCLLIGVKEKSDSFKYFEVKDLPAWKIRNYQNSDFEETNFDSLQNDVWVLVPKYLRPAAEKILAQSVPLEVLLGEDDNISNGIQTSANDVYIFQPIREDGQYYYFEKDSEGFKVEKELTRPYFQTSRGDDNLYTYRPFTPNSRVIYPYKSTSGHIEYVPIQEMEAQYPYLFNYLLSKKEKLQKRDIKPEPETTDEWYKYGRHQALEKCEVNAKIIVGVLSVGNKYAIDFHQTLISSGGTAGYCMIVIPENSPYSIYYIQAILNSKYVEWYSSLLGEVFRGGYIAKGTKTLKRLPIRAIDFSNQEEVQKHFLIAQRQQIMISVYAKMEEYKAIGDKRELLKKQDHFNRLSVVQNREIASLYDLGSTDVLIPSIQELYATN